jgi:replicative DNA helicase
MGESNKGETYVKIAKHRNGSLDTIKLKAELHIQRFIEEEGGGDFNPNLGGGSWKPVQGGGGDDGASMYVQRGSKMNDGQFDDEAPF